jgi:hypothetical protein
LIQICGFHHKFVSVVLFDRTAPKDGSPLMSNHFSLLACRIALMGIVAASCYMAASAFAQPMPSTPGMGYGPASPTLPLNKKGSVITVEQLERVVGTVPPVTIVAQDEPIQNVLDEIGRKSGVKLQATEPTTKRKISLNLPEPVSFWEAMVTLMDAGKVSVYQRDSHMLVGRPRTQPQLAGPVVQRGSFVVMAVGATRDSKGRAGLSASHKPAAGTTHVDLLFQFLPHPKLHVSSGGTSYFLGAEDELGNSYKPQRPQLVRNLESSLFTLEGQRLTVPSVSTKARLLKSVRGDIRVRILMSSQRWEVNDILNAGGVSKNFANVKVTLQSIELKEDKYTLRLVAVPDDNPDVFGAEPAHYIQIWWSGIFSEIGKVARLLDAEGKPLQFVSIRYDNHGYKQLKAEAILEFQRTDTKSRETIAGEPATLAWDVPMNIRTVRVPFEFTDIPIK